MRRLLSLASVLLLTGCSWFDGAEVPAPDPTPSVERGTTGLVQVDAARSWSVGEDGGLRVDGEPLPGRWAEVRFDEEGLRARLDGGSFEVLAPPDPEHPERPTGLQVANVDALTAWAGPLAPNAVKRVVVAMPADTPFQTVKAVLHDLHVHGAREAIFVVEGPQGVEAALVQPYPEIADFAPRGPMLKVLADPRGVSLEGLSSFERIERKTYMCEPACTTPDTLPLHHVTRLALRGRVEIGLERASLIPHSDLRWDAVVALLQALRVDPRPEAEGPLMTEVSVAGMRSLLPAPDEHLLGPDGREQLLELRAKKEAEQAAGGEAETDATTPATAGPGGG